MDPETYGFKVSSPQLRGTIRFSGATGKHTAIHYKENAKSNRRAMSDSDKGVVTGEETAILLRGVEALQRKPLNLEP